MIHHHRQAVAFAALITAFGFAAPVRAQMPAPNLDGPVSVPTVTAPAPPPPNMDSRFLGGLSFKDGTR